MPSALCSIIRPITELCRIISGSVSNEHSFAAQLEAIYKYGRETAALLSLCQHISTV